MAPASLKRVEKIEELRAAVAEARRAGKLIGFVPTLGGLHAGHGSLIEAARRDCGYVVVSVFLNALQFGPGEDFDAYPRDLEADQAFCERHGADVLFAPSHEEMYPREQLAFVEVDRLSGRLGSAFRPGHMRGVATVVAKLLNIVQPDFAYFGEKDPQQLAVVRRMTEDLNMPARIVACPTVREADGLAMSTRNRYLSPEERRRAPALHQALEKARSAAEAGERSAAALAAIVRGHLQRSEIEPQFVEVVDPDTLEPLETVTGRALIALAAYVGKTRLIDNVIVEV